MSRQIHVLEYLERSAQRHGEKIAFADEKTQLTFAELLEAAQALGTRIARLGVRRAPIAVLCGREVDAVVAMFAVLYSGNFYIPMDPQTPPERLAIIRERSNPAAVIATAKTARYLALWEGLPALRVGEDCQADAALLADIRRDMIDTDPCYMIFTSGSTGVPKGVAVAHRSVIDFVDWYCDTCGIVTEDVLGNQAPFFFDLSVKNLYGGLARGCTVHLLPKKFFSFPALLMDYIESHGITVLSWATSAFRLVASSGILDVHAPQCIRLVIVGGEALHGKTLNIWRKALEACQYINLYGPTETTVDCTYFIIDREYDDADMVPIGKACQNKRVYLLDENRRPAPKGTPGEICVGGTGVALGYYGEAEKTAAVFIQNPLNPYYPDVLYCTGDIGVEDEEGNIVYLSRKDSQIKHMGYRIELGEIEAAVASIPGVNAVACLFDESKDQILCVYQGQGDTSSVSAAAAKRLPKYMHPSVYYAAQVLPSTANGKIDRAALRREYLREDS